MVAGAEEVQKLDIDVCKVTLISYNETREAERD